MKNLIFITCILFSCTTNQRVSSRTFNNSTEQIQSGGPGQGLPGKCYSKMKLNGVVSWYEVLCETKLTKQVIHQIQSDLVRLGYSIDEKELQKKRFGESTKNGIVEFQKKNNMAYGGIDWATINRLKMAE